MDPTLNIAPPNLTAAEDAAQGIDSEEMLIQEFANFWFDSELIDDLLEDVNEE
ncbi:MAG: hypothetical protein AAF509_14655 [Pseudomonadota bacterium]